MILAKVKSGDWIFPLSIIYVSETTLRASPKSRGTVAETMLKISNGYSIKSFFDVQKDELTNTFLAISSPEETTQINAIIKNPLVKVGAEELDIDLKIDLPLDIKQEAISFIKNNIKDDLSIEEIILNRYNQECTDAMYHYDNVLTIQMNKDRDKLLDIPKKDRYVAFLIHRFYFLIEYLKIKIEVPAEIFDDKNKILKLLEGVPSLDVSTKLTYSLLKDKERPIHKHDNRDINFLSTAIPYCDVVITEKTWKHLAKTTKLDSKYSTKIENDLNCLLKLV